MPKIYAVKEHSGSYEDYRCDINHIFSTSEKAQKYIDKEKIYWRIKEKDSKECEQCPLYFNVNLYDVKDKDLFIQKSRQKCNRFSLSDDKKIMTCFESLWYDSIPSFNIMEYEIE